jgi:hypothetical protein
MLGCPYAHAEFIGAVLADALGYGYIDLRYSVPVPLDRDPADPLMVQARIDFARELAADESITGRHVWCLTDHRVLSATTQTLENAGVGCAIYVRSEDGLLARGSEVWGVPFEEMLELRSRIDSLVASVDWPVLTVVMPDKLLGDDAGEIDRDHIADIAMLAAVDVWTQLRDSKFLPGEPRGRLASMFDARGRPIGHRRIPMIEEQINMSQKRWAT